MSHLSRIADRIIRHFAKRSPDFIVGGVDHPYLRRWYVIPRNPIFNIYLHQFLRNDDDRALHDHPWFWCSILLSGGYVEHAIAAGGIHKRAVRMFPSIKVSSPWRAHRIELFSAWWREDDVDAAFEMYNANPNGKSECWTLFITGPRIREWGFHCPQRGWVNWRDFTDPNDTGAVGKGCDA